MEKRESKFPTKVSWESGNGIDTQLPGWRYRPRNLFYQSMWYLNQAMPYKAIQLSSRVLSLLKKKDIRGNIFNVNFTIASSYASLGKTKKAEQILKRVIPYLVKVKLKKRRDLLNVLTEKRAMAENYYRLDENILPTVKLVIFLKHGYYLKALKYEEKKGLQSNFHKYIFFYPGLILDLLNKGKPTYLQKKILRLPVFNKEIPVYNVKFLGNVVIHKNQKYLRTKLAPKECAFCIHVALRIGESHKKIPLDVLYKNFWPHSTHPTRNLSHLLTKIKKELRIPPHLLVVSYKKDEEAIINKGIYFTTDYSEFNEAIIQAHAFLRAGE